MRFEPDYIEKLAKIISNNELTEISLEDGEQAITIRKEHPDVVMTQPSPNLPVVQTPQSIPQAESTDTQINKKNESPAGRTILSPMVGTFYSASSPEAAPFVEIGSNVQVGDVVCIIEAMKLMNEIKAEQAGRVTKICVKNGDPVEFGQVLMYVE